MNQIFTYQCGCGYISKPMLRERTYIQKDTVHENIKQHYLLCRDTDSHKKQMHLSRQKHSNFQIVDTSKSSSSHKGVIFVSQGHLETCGDTFGSHKQERVYYATSSRQRPQLLLKKTYHAGQPSTRKKHLDPKCQWCQG